MKRFFIFLLSALGFVAGLINSLGTPIFAHAEHETIMGMSIIGIFGGAVGMYFSIFVGKTET